MLAAREEAVVRSEKALADRQTAVAGKEAELARKEAELAGREAAVAAQEAALWALQCAMFSQRSLARVLVGRGRRSPSTTFDCYPFPPPLGEFFRRGQGTN